MKKQINLRVPNRLKLAYESKLTKYQCIVCDKFHNPIENNNEFLTFAGDIYLGLDGGMIGCNFNSLGQLNRIMICCRKDKCLDQITHYLMGRIQDFSDSIDEDYY